MRSAKARFTHRADGGDRLHQGFGRAARFRDDDETRGGEIEACERAFEGASIEIVVEAGARALGAAMLVVAGNAPTPELGEGLAAEARAAGAEEDERPRAFGQTPQRLACRPNVVAPIGHSEQRQGSVGIGFTQSGKARFELGEIGIEQGLGQP